MALLVDADLAPSNSGSWATHSDVFGKGGFRSVADNTARDAITTARRSAGMWVYSTASATLYKLGAGLTNADWSTVSLSGALPVASATGQTIVWNGSAYVAGALDLADTDARTGVLPFGNGGTGLSSLTGHSLKVLRVNAAETAYELVVAAAGLTGPANPGDNGKVAIASAGNLTYALLLDANVATSAAIAYSKLAAGTAGHWLTVDASGVVTGSNTTLANKIISVSNASLVGAQINLRHSRGTSAAPTAHVADDELASFYASGHDGAAYEIMGGLSFFAEAAGGTSKRARFESWIHDGTAFVKTGTFKRFPRTVTTDATQTTVLSVAIAANTTVKLNIIWHGLETAPGTTNMAHRETSLTVRRSGSGNVVEVGHTDGVRLFRDDGTWGDESFTVHSLNIATQSVDIMVKGKTGATITWTGEVSYSSYG